ncbi:hypothetical protein CYPRO_1470 [Cyclonatronum proteinivorum]|uniref:Ig-like domain (Group 2) n=2 Tax=Cyclonatronum proteinivorum TaxID=1457365 RepID=A0A345UJS4_9BACT|nr:hypothetical protein CYPRO_1470 [Cyclonatronum proteinivorum]
MTMMKQVITHSKYALLAALLLMLGFSACERSVDGLPEAEFSSNPEVFIDGFSPGLEYFPFEGSVLNAFTVDTETFFGNRGASMRFDVPNVGDPAGAFAGAIFRDDFGGRNLTSYNALTFYAKATRGGTINEIGFGQDFLGNEFEATQNNLQLTTNWRKYTIPIPDPSVLTQSRGLFWYAEGPENGEGYSFWIDELRYEFVEDIAQPRPAIQQGTDASQILFIGSGAQVTGLTYTANLGDGQDVTVSAAPAYFDFASSNTSVATVNDAGRVTVVGEGEAVITASLAGVDAAGSLRVESLGEFIAAPTPEELPENVISIFSDVPGFDDVPVDFYNGFYEPFQTTTSNDFEVDGDRVLAYENFNFVGIEFNQNVPTIDASEMTHLSLHIFLPDTVPPNSAFRARIVNNLGGAGGPESSASATVSNNTGLVSGEWVRVLVPLTGMPDRSNLGQIVFDSDQGPGLQGSTIWVDNIYLFNANAAN